MLVEFDRDRCRAWLTAKPHRDPDPDWNMAHELGIDGDVHLFVARDTQPDGTDVDHFVSVLDQLVVNAATQFDTGWTLHGVEVSVFRTADGDGVDGGCLVTVDLPSRVRLASPHRSPRAFNGTPSGERDHTGVDAALDALQYLTTLVNGMGDQYRQAALTLTAKDLHARIVDGIEEPDGNWPGADLAQLVSLWLAEQNVAID